MNMKKAVFILLLLFCFASSASGNEQTPPVADDGCVVPGMFGLNWTGMDKAEATTKAQVFATELNARPGCESEAKKLLENVEELIANK